MDLKEESDSSCSPTEFMLVNNYLKDYDVNAPYSEQIPVSELEKLR